MLISLHRYTICTSAILLFCVSGLTVTSLVSCRLSRVTLHLVQGPTSPLCTSNSKYEVCLITKRCITSFKNMLALRLNCMTTYDSGKPPTMASGSVHGCDVRLTRTRSWTQSERDLWMIDHNRGNATFEQYDAQTWDLQQKDETPSCGPGLCHWCQEDGDPWRPLTSETDVSKPQQKTPKNPM